MTFRKGDKVKLREVIIGHVYSDYIRHQKEVGIIESVYPRNSCGWECSVKWPSGGVGSSNIGFENLVSLSKFRKGDSVTNGYITLKIENKLVNEDEWWLVSRKKLI